MSDDVAKLLRTVEDLKKDFNNRFNQATTKENLDRLTKTIENYTIKLEENTKETVKIHARLDIYERWIKAIADKRGILLP